MAPRVLSQRQGICQDWPRLARFLDISWHIHNLENAMFQTWKSPGYFFNDTQHLIQVTIIIIIIDMTNQKDRHESDFPAKRKTTHIILRWFDSCFSCWVAQTFSTPARPCFWQAWAFRLAIESLWTVQGVPIQCLMALVGWTRFPYDPYGWSQYHNLFGGWATPLKNMSQLGRDDEIPNIWKNKKCSKPPTSHNKYQ